MTIVQRAVRSHAFAVTLAVVAVAVSSSSSLAVSAEPDCRTAAAELREHLEVVTEAVIDGRGQAVPVSADLASSWWRAHRASLKRGPHEDSLVQRLAHAAHTRAPLAAARHAVQLSMDSFSWCDGGPTRADQLMILDLAGMAGWLRAHGQQLDWPAGLQAASASLAAELDTRKHQDLSKRLAGSVAALLADSGRDKVRESRARDLLELVDVIEKVVL